MNTSDFVSSPPVPANGRNASKTGHLKLVNKAFKDDSDTSDALLGRAQDNKTKASKANSHMDSKSDKKISNTDTMQGQFSTLLEQVEKKLSATPMDVGNGDQTVESDKTDDESNNESGSDGLKTQNGTTSLFAGAFMMRGWEPAMIAQADAATVKIAEDEKMAAANSNRVQSGAKTAESKLQASAALDAKQFKADANLKMPDGTQQPAKNAESVAISGPSNLKLDGQSNARISQSDALPRVQVTTDLNVDEQAGSHDQSSLALSSGSSVKTDAKIIADAQAQGVISSIHVARAQDTGRNGSRDSDQGKDQPKKDQSFASTRTGNNQQPGLQLDAAASTSAAAAAALQQSEAPSPVSQVVERILQELPAQSAAANADQVAQVSKVMTVQLHPEGLGNVLIKISNSGGNLKISMSSEQQNTSDKLESDSSQLLQALQQVMPTFSADDLSFSTQDQGTQDQLNNGAAGQNAAGGNANSGQWNEGQSYAEQGGRQVPDVRSYSGLGQAGVDAQKSVDVRNTRRAGNIYL